MDIKNLFPVWFEGDGAGGGGVIEPPVETVTPPVSPPAPSPVNLEDKAGGEEDPPVEPDTISLPKTAFNDRLERAVSSGESKALKALGFDDVAAAKKFIADGKAAIKAQMTAEELRAAEIEEARTEKEKSDTRAEQAEHRALQAELKAAALGLMGQFANPASAFKLLELKDVVRNEDGSFEKLDEAITQLAEDEPWTLAQATTPTKKKGAPKIGATDPPEGADEAKESEDEKRKRFFGKGESSGFFDSDSEGRVVLQQ